MKKLLLMLLLFSFTLVSCNKDSIQRINDTQLSDDVFKLILDENDEKNSKINQIIYHFANAIEQAKENEVFLKLIIDEINISPVNQASIIEIAQKSNEFKQFLNTEIEKTLALSPSFEFTNSDYITELSEIMKYNKGYSEFCCNRGRRCACVGAGAILKYFIE